MYEELKERFKEAEKAHDSYVMDLEEAAEAEEVWISNLTARFDKLELEVGEVIGSPLSGKSKFNPGAETTDITGLKSGSSRQDVHLPHQIPKPSDTGHTQMSGMPPFGGTKYGEEATHELRQWGGLSEQGKLFNARDDPMRVHNDRVN